MKFLVPFLAVGVCASTSDLLSPRQDVGAVGEASCAEIGKNLGIENVTVNFAQVSGAGVVSKRINANLEQVSSCGLEYFTDE